ncbi:phage antirepressor N-terminal domain-containing protein [Candidatus Oscillochloris fontis]|uniref:phage antirepressor N-terminal domain-containing protein n=1 Tax=Candidatus Oscillochloris fontis TaxID=2496868 RepID=UPI001375B8E7|nr:phage antirepressor N-terminal domain-containing protein [Candidatus Oscillochloris fontis]
MNWFYAEDILAWLGNDPNRTYVPIAELCEALGMGAVREERRLRGHAVLSAGARRLPVETETGDVVMLCLRVELLPLWLVTLDAGQVVDPAGRARLELFQREAASILWQTARPQGFDSGDLLLPTRHQQGPAEQAYVGSMAMATLARQQMLIERQLDGVGSDAAADDQGNDPWARQSSSLDDPAAARLAQTVRRVAQSLAERTRRNEYFGVFSGLYRNFSISSYRRMPSGRLYEALEWLERWYGDMIGEPEPPPDI